MNSETNASTKTAGQAHDIMAEAKGYYVAMARFVAVQVANKREPWYSLAQTGPDPEKRVLLPEPGTVHAYAVRMAMERFGVMDGYTGPLFFMGTAMKAEIFEPTGVRFTYSHQGDEGRSVHKSTINVWKLKQGAGAGAFVEPTMPEDIRKRRDEFRAQEAEAIEARNKALKAMGAIK